MTLSASARARLQSAVLATLVCASGALWGCGGTTTKQAGLNTSDLCTFSQNTQYANSGASGGVIVGGLLKDTPCGYVVGKDSAVVPLSVSLTAPCASIGTQSSPSGCNDYGGTNRVYVTDLLNGQGTTFYNYAWATVAGTQIAKTIGTFDYHLKPFATFFKDTVTATFAYRGSLTSAVGTAVLYGRRLPTNVASLSGTTTLDVTQYGTWTVSAGAYDVRLFRYRWYVDGSLSSGDTTATLIHSIYGPNSHSISARVIFADSTVDTVTVSVTPQLHAAISGPNAITAPGYYTWSAIDPGAAGGTVTYAWTMVDGGAGTTTSLGGGSSVTMAVSQTGPSASFRVELSVSASGFSANSASVEVTNYLIDSCGGVSCLKIAPHLSPSPAAARKRVH